MRKRRNLTLMVGAAMFVILTGIFPARAEEPESCVKPAKGPIGMSNPEKSPATGTANFESRSMPLARVGRPAPDFEANAFMDGGFKNIKLSDYKGKWVVLCFYPGDFTFV